jgi:hypothetical protein
MVHAYSLETGGCFFRCGKQVNESINASDFQSVFHESSGTCDSQIRARFVDLALTHNQDADASAVEYGDSAQIKNDFFGLIGEDFRKF